MYHIVVDLSREKMSNIILIMRDLCGITSVKVCRAMEFTCRYPILVLVVIIKFCTVQQFCSLSRPMVVTVLALLLIIWK